MAGNKNSGGRNKRPASLHILTGTFRPDRHAGDATPEPPVGTPTTPKALSREAKAEWDRMVHRLTTAKTLTIVDDAALYQYCELFAETEQIKIDHVKTRQLSAKLMKAIKDLQGAELVEAVGRIVSLQGILARHSQQLRQGHMAIRQYLVEFGMTPSARTRVKLPASAEKPKSKIDALLSGTAG